MRGQRSLAFPADGEAVFKPQSVAPQAQAVGDGGGAHGGVGDAKTQVADGGHLHAVLIEKMKTRDNGILDIDATIYCERETHKRIIIGKNGAMLKKISTYARQDIERFFDCKVFLQTWIKVKEDWRNRAQLVQNFGYDERNFD